jgi:hypothetical protein
MPTIANPTSRVFIQASLRNSPTLVNRVLEGYNEYTRAKLRAFFSAREGGVDVVVDV